MNTKQKPTIDQLNESWNDFLKVGIYQDQRFGQYFYNQYEYEVGNSYNIERPYKAYQFLYENLVTTLDGVAVGSETSQWHNMTYNSLKNLQHSPIEFREAPKYVVLNGITFKDKESLLRHIANNYNLD